MRGIPVVTVVMGAGLLLAGVAAHAQVTTNDGALESLAPQRAPVTRSQTPHRATPRPAAPRTEPKAALPAPAKTVKPAIPVSPPAILALPPAVAVPLAHPPPPPVIPLADDAPGTVTPLPTGLRITFGADRADISPANAAALTEFATTQLSQTAGINIFAYATGSAEDPSTPRRLSLQRALTARAVLLKAGIPSPRIYPRALGPAGGDDPDRVDVVTGSPSPPPTSTQIPVPQTPMLQTPAPQTTSTPNRAVGASK